MEHHYSHIPTWNGKDWTYTEFNTQNDFRDFVEPLFKEPGKYYFDETSFLFNEQARIWNSRKKYCLAPEGSLDFRAYWDLQKERCRFGAIFQHGNNTWYLPREYYMWINFLPINDKIEKKIDFPKLWDGQYHMALYELLAELYYKHCAITKKRQFGSSYYHMGKLINLLWFEESPILKIGASLKDYINEKGSWKFLNEYKSFLNKETAWYRPMNPSKVLMWQQQIEETDADGRPTLLGLKGTLQGVSFDKDPTTGVGGAIRIFFYEEAGISSTMDKTVEYLFPAMEAGDLTTGLFIAAGSVGELQHCGPLKNMMYFPQINSIYPVETNLLDDKGTIGRSGLFIPEQWCRPPHIDQYGNSQVEAALESLNKLFAEWKSTLSPEQYQLRVSQRPRNIAEAFDFREVSLFPLHLVKAQQRRIQEKEYFLEYIDLSYDDKGEIVAKESNRRPIDIFPIKMAMEDKTGVIVVNERPIKGSEWGTYFASVDPVSQGKSITSESLCSIYIYKNPVEVKKQTVDGFETSIERDKVVAWWTGRFDDINKTHERLKILIEWYNAWTVVENNVSLFILYMINERKQKYLVPRDQMLFLKELSAKMSGSQDYGWRNSGVVFKSNILSYFVEFLSEVIDEETKPDGEVIRRTYGIERIPDIMVMTEMIAYGPDVNVDRLVALAALIAFAKVQQSNISIKKRLELIKGKNLVESKNLYKLTTRSPFSNLGGAQARLDKHRSPFRNIK